MYYWYYCISYTSVDPELLPNVQVDSGAIKYILGGADVMCPGLTSAGGSLPDLEVGAPVVSLSDLIYGLRFRLSWQKGSALQWLSGS